MSNELSSIHWLRAYTVAGIGVVLFLSVLVWGLVGPGSKRMVLAVPATHVVNLQQAGRYVVYHEYARTADAQGKLKPPGAENIRVKVTTIPEGRGLEVSPVDHPDHYKYQRRWADALFSFVAPRAGQYTLDAAYPAGTKGPNIDLVLRQKFSTRLYRTLPQLTGVFLLTVAAIALVARRRRPRNGTS